MRYYSAMINLAGDRNNIAHKSRVSAPELLLLQAIHGTGNVYDVELDPSTNSDRTPQHVVKEQLNKVYGRSRIGEGSDRKPALVAVFPGWPNVQLPTDALEAGIPSNLFIEVEQKPASRRSKGKTEETFME